MACKYLGGRGKENYTELCLACADISEAKEMSSMMAWIIGCAADSRYCPDEIERSQRDNKCADSNVRDKTLN